MVSSKKIKKGSEILDALASIQAIRTIPTVLHQILAEISNPDVEIRKIAVLIMKDQALTVGVLRLVNSTLYFPARKVTSLKHAIILLGLKKIRDIVLTTVLINHFNLSKATVPQNYFWEHALGCAKGAALLEKKSDYPADDVYYVAGLVHDIGELIWAQYFPDEFKFVYNHANEKSINLFEGENELFGITHCDLGEKLAMMWKFPPYLIQTIKYHHSPELAQHDQKLVATVNLSDIFTRLLGLNYGIYEAMMISLDELPSFKILQKNCNDYAGRDWKRFSMELTDQFQIITESVKKIFE